MAPERQGARIDRWISRIARVASILAALGASIAAIAAVGALWETQHQTGLLQNQVAVAEESATAERAVPLLMRCARSTNKADGSLAFNADGTTDWQDPSSNTTRLSLVCGLRNYGRFPALAIGIDVPYLRVRSFCDVANHEPLSLIRTKHIVIFAIPAGGLFTIGFAVIGANPVAVLTPTYATYVVPGDRNPLTHAMVGANIRGIAFPVYILRTGDTSMRCESAAMVNMSDASYDYYHHSSQSNYDNSYYYDTFTPSK